MNHYIEIERGSSLAVKLFNRIVDYKCGTLEEYVEIRESHYRTTPIVLGEKILAGVGGLCLKDAQSKVRDLTFSCAKTVRTSNSMSRPKSALIFSDNTRIGLNFPNEKIILQCGGRKQAEPKSPR